MLTIGDKFPDFSVTGVVSTNPANAFQDFTQGSDKGKWKLIFFWPKDFTFVCPTEIAGFGKLNGDFNDRDTVIYGVSTDSEFVHLAWRQNRADLKTLPARLRMNVIGKPGVDKADFELWCLAVSAMNGCGVCIDSHEKILRKAGLSAEQIQAAIRIAAVVHAVAVTLDGEAHSVGAAIGAAA